MAGLKCVVCGKEIDGRYWVDQWGNCSCVEHEPKLCHSCHRLIGRYSTYSTVSGQIGFQVDATTAVCGLCQETCINSTSAVVKSTDFVMKLLGRAGFHIHRDGIKAITVVTHERMHKMAPSAAGLCVSSVNPNNPKLSTSEIFILNGLPKIEFESVLAHEVLHFWVYYNGVEDGESVEGFCNIGSSLVLNYYSSRAASHLADHLKGMANNNPDYYYGVKFIEQKKKLQALGWENYINDILRKKRITP